MKNMIVSVCFLTVLIASIILLPACDQSPLNTASGRKKTDGSGSVLAQSLNKVKTGVACDNHLRQLYMYCRDYRDENGQTLSAGETALNHLVTARNIPHTLLSCPAGQPGSRNNSAIYLFCGLSSRPQGSGLPVFFDKPGNHADGTASVLLDNGETLLLKGPFKTCTEILSALCTARNYPPEISNYYKQMGTAFDRLYKISR